MYICSRKESERSGWAKVFNVTCSRAANNFILDMWVEKSSEISISFYLLQRGCITLTLQLIVILLQQALEVFLVWDQSILETQIKKSNRRNHYVWIGRYTNFLYNLVQFCECVRHNIQKMIVFALLFSLIASMLLKDKLFKILIFYVYFIWSLGQYRNRNLRYHFSLTNDFVTMC